MALFQECTRAIVCKKSKFKLILEDAWWSTGQFATSLLSDLHVTNWLLDRIQMQVYLCSVVMIL